jgi:hypothetical protein
MSTIRVIVTMFAVIFTLAKASLFARQGECNDSFVLATVGYH